MENTTELLALANDTFDHFFELIRRGNVEEAETFLYFAEQPPQWAKECKSELIPGTTYKTNPIGLLDAVMDKLFGAYWYCEQEQTIISQHQGKFAVTTTVTVGYEIVHDSTLYTRKGIATAIAPTIEHLVLASPLSVTEAKKNAFRNISGLLGRNLNRSLEDQPIEKGKYISIDADSVIAAMLEAINKCEFQEDAWRIVEESGDFKTMLTYNRNVQEAIKNKKPRA